MSAARWRMAWTLLAALAAPGSAAQEQVQLKAAFIYRFAQLTQWPPPPQREFTYCVAGDIPLQEALRVLMLSTPGGASAHTILMTEPQRAPQCQLLVLGAGVSGDLRRWQEALKDDPVLVLGDSAEAFHNGAVIGLVIDPNGLAFRINQTEARRRGLALSYQMLKLAREVK